MGVSSGAELNERSGGCNLEVDETEGMDKESAECAAMVAERNLPEDFVDTASGPSISNALEQLVHVKLDREKITSIDIIRYVLSLPSMTHLYLQQNGLKSLSGIALAKGLKFLIVSHNQLTELVGLSALSQLKVLDASDNAISRIDAAELSQSLSFLNLDGNPCCTSQEDFREHLKTALPNLKELDGEPLTDYSCSDCSTESDATTDEEEDDECVGGTCKEADHVGKIEEQAGVPPVFRTPGDIGEEVTTCRKPCTASSRSGVGCIRSSRTSTPVSSKMELPLPPIPEIVERLGTPSCVAKALGSTPMPHPDQVLDDALDADMVEYYQLKESLYENNLDAEGAVQIVLSYTVGGLDYHCDRMIQRSRERMKDLDVQLGQEFVQMFFSPETSPRSTPTSVDQSQEASTSSNISGSVMSPTSVDHWKYVASTSSEYSTSKESPSGQIRDTAGLSYQESHASDQEDRDEV